MNVPSEISTLALQNVGKICSVHWNTLEQVVRFQWARVCATEEEAEMVDCELERAAVPGQPYGASFERVADYRSDNRDNLQVSELVDFLIVPDEPLSRCHVRTGDAGELGGSVDFRFAHAHLLIAPERKEKK